MSASLKIYVANLSKSSFNTVKVLLIFIQYSAVSAEANFAAASKIIDSSMCFEERGSQNFIINKDLCVFIILVYICLLSFYDDKGQGRCLSILYSISFISLWFISVTFVKKPWNNEKFRLGTLNSVPHKQPKQVCHYTLKP